MTEEVLLSAYRNTVIMHYNRNDIIIKYYYYYIMFHDLVLGLYL